MLIVCVGRDFLFTPWPIVPPIPATIACTVFQTGADPSTWPAWDSIIGGSAGTFAVHGH